MKNKFITVEGLDGSGKTTVVLKIIQYLNNKGILNILRTHEPGGTPISDVLRNLIKNSVMHESIDSTSELLMIYAARIQLLNHVILPALSRGDWVISDRFDLSSQAYQGGGRSVDRLLLRILSNRIINVLSPDLILYLDIPVETSIDRVKNRGIFLDRIEQESVSFFNRVRACYKKLAITKKNIIMIDATQSLKDVSYAIFEYLDWWLEN